MFLCIYLFIIMINPKVQNAKVFIQNVNKGRIAQIIHSLLKYFVFVRTRVLTFYHLLFLHSKTWEGEQDEREREKERKKERKKEKSRFWLENSKINLSQTRKLRDQPGSCAKEQIWERGTLMTLIKCFRIQFSVIWRNRKPKLWREKRLFNLFLEKETNFFASKLA